jgi:hypothetical protein
MDNLQKYKKIRGRLEFFSYMISLIVGSMISSQLGIYGKKLISTDTALSLAIIIGLSLVLSNISIKIADNWYKKNKDK